ncbi:MAG: ComEC/Rec2 family competence protein [Flavobacteriaceae bacterium]
MKNIPPQRLEPADWRTEEATDPDAGWAVRFAEAQSDRLFLWLPVMFGAGAAIYLGLPDEPAIPVLLAALALALGAAWFYRLNVAAFTASAALCALLAGVAIAALNAHEYPTVMLERRAGPVEFAATVLTVEEFADGRTRALLLLDEPDAGVPERVRLSWRGRGDALRAGDRIAGRAILMPPPDEAVPGGYDFRRAAYFSGFGAVGYTLGPPHRTGQVERPSLAMRIEHFRDWLAERISSRIEGDSAAVAAALLTGRRSAIPDEATESLRVSGLGHLLAISGLHMVLVAGSVFAAIRLFLAMLPDVALRWPIKRIAAAVALAAATAFLVVSGAAIATQRAYVMMAVMLVAVMLDRPAMSLRNFAIAALVVLAIHPDSIAGPSFQMSFAATTALIAAYEGAGAWRRRFFWQESNPLALRAMGYVVAFVGGILLTTIIAGLATAPFGAYHFNRTTPFAIAANMAAMPAVSLLVMPAGVLGLALIPFGLDEYAWRAMGHGIDFVVAVAARVSALDGADMLVASFPLVSLVAMVAGGLWLSLWRGPLRLAGLAGIAAGLLTATASDPPAGYVDREGQMAAIADAGRLHVVGTRNIGYVRDVWARSLGISGDAVEFTRCKDDVCTVETTAMRLAFVTEPDAAAWAELCRTADLIVVASWRLPPRGLSGRCGARIVDRAMRGKLGAIAIRRDEGGIMLAGARSGGGRRPWSFGYPTGR